MHFRSGIARRMLRSPMVMNWLLRMSGYSTVHRSRDDPRKECVSCGNTRFHEAAVLFVTTKLENIRPSNMEMNKAVTMLKLPNVCS
jgi:hypothetical protein